MDGLTRRRMVMLTPLALAAAAGGAFTALMVRMREGHYDPHSVPSMLIGKKLPMFTLPGQGSSAGFSSADVLAGPRPALVNFFASWCIPCAEEAPTLAALKAKGVTIWGIAYKDTQPAASGFLDRFGNPYFRVARDEAGITAINFGLYGVPESYLVDQDGIVRWRWAGGLSPDIMRQDLLPKMRAMS